MQSVKDLLRFYKNWVECKHCEYVCRPDRIVYDGNNAYCDECAEKTDKYFMLFNWKPPKIFN